MLPILHRDGYCGMTEMHRYHCECMDCELSSGYPLRSQTDSSCGGEIISGIFENIADALGVFEALQAAAIDADAEPGYNAGFHVHVRNGALRHRDRVAMLWQWLRWEPTMNVIAQGVFSEVRSFNPPMRDRLRYYRDDHFTVCEAGLSRANWLDLFRATEEWDTEALESLTDDLFMWSQDVDRHSTICTNTRFGTFEFRLWNSTRSAWRMELFCRMSIAWMDPMFHDLLADLPLSRIRTDNIATIMQMLDVYDTRLAELVDRQVTYTSNRAGMGDPIFTLA